MARTKKEIEEQASATEPETTGTESDPIPQTDPETPPGEVANAGMTDLELAAANTLDPDAPQTDLESGEDTGGQAAFPQTDPEWNPDDQSEPGEEGFAPQTDLESADSDTGSHTDLESAETPGDGQALDAESVSGPQTEFETELADDNSAQAAGDDAAEGDAEPPAPSRRRRASRKKATEAQDGGEDEPAEHPEEEQSDSGQPQKLRMPGRRRQRVVSIDAERTVETDTDRLRNDLLDLVESLKSKKILTGTIQGVERLADNPEMSYAVIYHGDFKVTPPGEVANAGMTDLELAAANTLDPDAPQTDLESGEDTGGQAAFPQTDPEWNPDDQSEPGEEGFAPQTDLESADSDTGSHTDLESAETPGDGQALDAESVSGPQTEFETELADDNSAQAAGDDAAEGDAEPPAPSRRRRASRKKATEAQDGGEDEPAEHPEEEQSDSGQPQKLRMPGRRRQRVVSIDAERTVETDTDRLRNDLLDLVESLKSKKILTGTIQGVERLADNPEMSYAVIYHGDFKVIIPVLEAIEEPADYRGQPKGDVLHYLLNKRLGAEVDYIVKGVDQEHNVVAASRLEAMALKRREYYFRTDRDGNYQIYEGIRAEARVISVIRAGIFVDLFGAECYIPLRELSYQRWVDAAQHYQPGQRVLVRVLEVDRSDRSHPRVTASVKQAMENPYEKALKKYVVGNRYVGTVSMVDLNGVFVSLDGGIDCLCTYPKRGRPPRGARATVRILGINHENNRIWGVITHMSTTR